MMDALVFAIPCLLSLEFTLVGRLFAAEILMLALAPILLLYRARLLAAPVPRTVLILGCMWLFSQIATDVIRGIPFGDYSRGWSKIAFTLINFSVLYMLLHNSRRRLVHFAVGLVIGVYFHHVLSPVPGAETEPWKFGLALPVTMMFVLGAQWGFERNATRMVSILLVVASGINLMMGFRSLAGICFVTAIFLFSQSRRLRPGARISGRRLALFAVIGVVGAIGFLEFYGYAARDGLLGAAAQVKYKSQAGGQYGVLLGGRMEVLVAIQAIADSPIIGHGSWAKDSKYRTMLFKLSGVSAIHQVIKGNIGLIPSHSFILGAWVDAGFLGAVFWAYILWFISRNLVFLNQIQEPLSPLIAFFSFIMLWDIAFSPFAFDRRILAPFYIIVVIFSWEMILAKRRSQHTGIRPPKKI